jgi:hypothetical protein
MLTPEAWTTPLTTGEKSRRDQNNRCAGGVRDGAADDADDDADNVRAWGSAAYERANASNATMSWLSAAWRVAI